MRWKALRRSWRASFDDPRHIPLTDHYAVLIAPAEAMVQVSADLEAPEFHDVADLNFGALEVLRLPAFRALAFGAVVLEVMAPGAHCEHSTSKWLALIGNGDDLGWLPIERLEHDLIPKGTDVLCRGDLRECLVPDPDSRRAHFLSFAFSPSL